MSADVEKNSDGSPKTLPPSPPDVPGKTITLAYHDFGPQVATHALLGMAWWSWSGGGCYERDDAFDVRVVVYRNITRAEVEKRFPTVRWKWDHRLVAYDDAVAHVDALSESTIPSLNEDMRNTKARLVAALGPETPGALENTTRSSHPP